MPFGSLALGGTDIRRQLPAFRRYCHPRVGLLCTDQPSGHTAQLLSLAHTCGRRNAQRHQSEVSQMLPVVAFDGWPQLGGGEGVCSFTSVAIRPPGVDTGVPPVRVTWRAPPLPVGVQGWAPAWPLACLQTAFVPVTHWLLLTRPADFLVHYSIIGGSRFWAVFCVWPQASLAWHCFCPAVLMACMGLELPRPPIPPAPAHKSCSLTRPWCVHAAVRRSNRATKDEGRAL